MKTILVTGGAGFIGSRFVKRILQNQPDTKVIVLDALTYAGSTDNLPMDFEDSPRIEFWQGNVTNVELVEELVSRSHIIYHFAAETHVTRSIFSNRVFVDTDVIGTHVLSNAIVKHRDQIELFVHISTSEVYGTALSEKIDESHPLNPMSPYASAKTGADRLVYSYWATYKIPAVIVRPFNNYGAHQHLEKVIPRFITSCILDEPLIVHGTGEAARDWIFVEDTCDFLEKLLFSAKNDIVGEVFNLGTGTHTSIMQIAHLVADLMKVKNPKIELIQDRPGQVLRHTCDYSKASSTTDWTPATSLEEGLLKTIQWYQTHPDWWQKQLSFRHFPIFLEDGTKVMH